MELVFVLPVLMVHCRFLGVFSLCFRSTACFFSVLGDEGRHGARARVLASMTVKELTAMKSQAFDVVSLLLDAKANADAKSADGRDAISAQCGLIELGGVSLTHF